MLNSIIQLHIEHAFCGKQDFRKAEEMIQLKEAELDELRQRFDAKLEESLLN